MNLNVKPKPSQSKQSVKSATGSIRFTSNVAGPIYFLADALSLLVTASIAVVVYVLLTGNALAPSVHLFAFVTTALTFFLIRASRNVYNRAAAPLFETEDDSAIEGVGSVLIASALVWQFGLIEEYSRGVVLTFLLVFVLAQVVARNGVRQILGRLANAGAIQQRIAFYGTDRASLAAIRETLSKLDLTHMQILGVADDSANRS